MSTAGELIESCARALGGAGLAFGHGTDNAWDEAVALVLGVTELADDRGNLEVPVPADQAARIEALLARRVGERIPLPYLLGRARFAGHDFVVEPGVVIPRSPLAELIEARFHPWLTRPPGAILDLCTGSGCIGIAAGLAFPAASVTLVDVDPQAVRLARRNVTHHGLDGRARVLAGDLYAPLPDGARFDLILANPPYVDAGDLASLPAEFRHEPVLGLDGGDDGLDLVRRILERALHWLASDGLLVCEVGMSAAALLRAFPRLPFVWPELERGGDGVFLLTAEALRPVAGMSSSMSSLDE